MSVAGNVQLCTLSGVTKLHGNVRLGGDSVVWRYVGEIIELCGVMWV